MIVQAFRQVFKRHNHDGLNGGQIALVLYDRSLSGACTQHKDGPSVKPVSRTAARFFEVMSISRGGVDPAPISTR
jgi:hypothetical protein